MFLFSVGMCSPVGLRAASSCAALRAGVTRFRDLPGLEIDGEPAVGAVMPDLPLKLTYENRLLHLILTALHDCLGAEPPNNLEHVPLFLCLPEPDRPGAELSEEMIPQVEAKLHRTFHKEHSAVFRSGHTSAFEALEAARNCIGRRQASVCVIAAVDSYIQPETLEWLHRTERLKTPLNPDGIIPGEGAAVVAIRRRLPDNAPFSVEVRGFGFAEEPASVLKDDPLSGTGLSQAAQAALEQSKMQLHEVNFRLADVTGERYGFTEHSLAVQRLMRKPKEFFPLWHNADSIGDLGAAAGAGHFVRAYSAWGHGYAPGPRAIVFGSNLAGHRAAAVFEARLLK